MQITCSSSGKQTQDVVFQQAEIALLPYTICKNPHKKSERTPVRPPSLSYLLAKILNVSVDTLCHDLSSVFTVLNIIDHSVLVFKCLVY